MSREEVENLPRVFPDKAGGLGSCPGEQRGECKACRGWKEHTVRSQLAVNVGEEERRTNRDIHVQISTLPAQPPPDKQRKFEGEWG